MKKILIISALALVALASCTKTEIRPSEIEEQEIRYQVAVGKMSTKAVEGTNFDPNAGFMSYVYQHQNSIWSPSAADAKLNKTNTHWSEAGANATYISNANITLTDGAWQAGTKYYWPKASYLTFFAWTDGVNATPSVNNVSFTHTEGIQVTNYSAIANKNTDFMVAEVAYNKDCNEGSHGDWANGVPTIFHHQMSLFKFKATTDKNYEDPAASAHSFYITKITLKNVKSVGDYTQLVADPSTTSSWSGQETPTDFIMFNASSSPAGAVSVPGQDAAVKGVKVGVNGAKVDLVATASEFEILLPQTFADFDPALHTINEASTPFIEIEYYAVDKIGESYVSKKLNKQAAIKVAYAGNWAQEHKYTLNLIFSLDEILWDPAVSTWNNDGEQDVVVK